MNIKLSFKKSRKDKRKNDEIIISPSINEKKIQIDLFHSIPA